jgi:transposase-like protein
MAKTSSAEEVVQDIPRNTRRRFSAEEKIWIVLKGLRCEVSIATLCRCEELNPNLYTGEARSFSRPASAGSSGRWCMNRNRPAAVPAEKPLTDRAVRRRPTRVGHLI